MSTLTKLVKWGLLAGIVGGGGWAVATGKLPFLKKPETAAAAPAIVAQAPAVSVFAIAEADFVETQLVTGTLVPREEILVGAEIEGLRVIEVLADEGQRVKKGDILARLVIDTLDAQLAQNDAAQARAKAGMAQAQSNITAAEARVVEAKNALDRARPLRSSGYLSEATLDQREAASRTAVASLAASKDALKLAEADLAQSVAQRRDLDWRRSRTDIRSPVDGIVSRRLARIGSAGLLSSDAMFRIIAKGEIELEAEIPETRLTRVREGQPVAMDPQAYPGLVGKVRIVSPEVDRATRLGRIRVALGDHPALRIGAFARGTITTANSRGLAVPSGAIQRGLDVPTVLVVRDGRVATQRLKLGLVMDERVEVLEGLKSGDLVVARAGTFLRDGDAVRAILEPRSAAAGLVTTGAIPAGSRP